MTSTWFIGAYACIGCLEARIQVCWCFRRPIAIKKGTTDEVDEALTANPYPTWKKLEEMVDKGKIRNIGVSK